MTKDEAIITLQRYLPPAVARQVLHVLEDDGRSFLIQKLTELDVEVTPLSQPHDDVPGGYSLFYHNPPHTAIFVTGATFELALAYFVQRLLEIACAKQDA